MINIQIIFNHSFIHAVQCLISLFVPNLDRNIKTNLDLYEEERHTEEAKWNRYIINFLKRITKAKTEEMAKKWRLQRCSKALTLSLTIYIFSFGECTSYRKHEKVY